MAVFKGKYKDIDSIIIDCGDVSFNVIPESGMKIASAKHKNTGFEFMHENPKGSDVFIRPKYNDVYGRYECAGFDDCFPTIDPYFGGKGPWEDVRMPDHGEVWSLPYTVEEQNDNFVRASVTGLRMPYTLTKTFSVKDSKTLHIEYKLKNLSAFEIKYLWAAHVMLNAQVGSKFLVPEECTEGICMFSNNDRIGKYFDRFTYPINTDKNGVQHDLSVMRPHNVNADEKYYFTNKLTKDGFIGVTYPENGLSLTMRFPTDKIPYIGIMNNECGWDGMYLCILEPCSALYDRPDLAEMHGCVSVIEAGEEISWYLDIEIGDRI